MSARLKSGALLARRLLGRRLSLHGREQLVVGVQDDEPATTFTGDSFNDQPGARLDPGDLAATQAHDRDAAGSVPDRPCERLLARPRLDSERVHPTCDAAPLAFLDLTDGHGPVNVDLRPVGS